MSYFLGIDLGGTRIKIALANEISILKVVNVEGNKEQNFKESILLIEKKVNEICSLENIQVQQIKSIGFSFPGLVNSTEKKIIATNDKFVDAKKFDWETWANKKYGATIYLENDAKMACIGEWKMGVGKPFNDLVVITLGTGVGTAVVMDGNLLNGKHYQAGNLGGHFTVNYTGNLCTCGNRGCVEAEASTAVLPQLVKKHPEYKNSILKDKENIDFSMIFKLSNIDKVAKSIRDHCIHIWSIAVVNCIHAYDPEAVIIVGGVMESKEVILPEIRKKVKELAWTPWGEVAVLSSELNNTAGVNGALFMAKHNKNRWEKQNQTTISNLL